MLRQVAAEGDELRPRIRHVNARFYYVTIFNCSFNDASNPFWNIALVIPDFLSFIIVARQNFDSFHLIMVCVVLSYHDLVASPRFSKYLRNLSIDMRSRERLTLVSMRLVHVRCRYVLFRKSLAPAPFPQKRHKSLSSLPPRGVSYSLEST